MPVTMTPVELAYRSLPKRRRLRKPRRQVFPRTIEFQYRRALVALVEKMRQAVMDRIVPEIPGMVEASPRRDSWRNDQTPAEKLRDLIRSTTLFLEEELSEEQLDRIVKQYAGDISSFNRLQVQQVFKSVLGVDLLSSEPQLEAVISGFVAENVSLIKSVQQQFLGQVEQVVLRGLRSGLRSEEIAKQLVGEGGRASVAESRAALIARDQTNKLYGQLTEMRQVSAGVEKYVWRTALDERVRPEHAEREGRTYSWSDPPADGHPGEPINCRCYAEPVIDVGQ